MNAAQNADAVNDRKPAQRRKALLMLTTLVLAAGAVWWAYDHFVASHYERTDNAYVQGPLIQITPQVGGTVRSVRVEETDWAPAGQTLVELDGTDARLGLEQAEAQLGQALRQVRTLYANNGVLTAQIALREAELAKSHHELARADDDFQRRQALAGTGGVSKEELGHAQAQQASANSNLAAAQAALTAAREQLHSNQAMTAGTTLAQHPTVVAAAARVREAWVAQQRTALVAPVDGYIAKRTVQLGQKVAAGAPLLTLVPLQQLWVDANFKEIQLRHIRIGQPVQLKADLYGQQVAYRGRVAGLGVGTGAAFSLLPAQNATGNWIKIVQRVPVRIALDPEQLKSNPLRVGLSMEATVDTSDRSGPALAEGPRAGAGAETQVLDQQLQGAEARIQRIIAAHTGARH